MDGQILGPSRLAALSGLPAAGLADAVLDLELAGLVRRTAAGIQAVRLPAGRPGHPP